MVIYVYDNNEMEMRTAQQFWWRAEIRIRNSEESSSVMNLFFGQILCELNHAGAYTFERRFRDQKLVAYKDNGFNQASLKRVLLSLVTIYFNSLVNEPSNNKYNSSVTKITQPQVSGWGRT